MNTRKNYRKKRSTTRKNGGGRGYPQRPGARRCGAKCPRAPRSDKKRLHLIGPNFPPCCVQCGCCMY